MRGQASAVYLFILNIIGLGLGPLVLAMVTEHVFADDMKIHYSLLTVTVVAHIASSVILFLGLPAFRRARERRDEWEATNLTSG
jgi:uncharacterized protein YqgC (DUF456 family)